MVVCVLDTGAQKDGRVANPFALITVPQREQKVMTREAWVLDSLSSARVAFGLL